MSNESPESIFLLIGQSNMYGCGPFDGVIPASNPKISMFQDQQWQVAKNPMHFKKPKNYSLGLGMSFAEELLRLKFSSSIGLIQCAFGGTPLRCWVPGAELYNNAIETFHRASKSSKLKGILWHQGESDSKDLKDAETYGPRLNKMIHQLRHDLHAESVPFISGELGHFISNNNRFPLFNSINHQLSDLKQNVPFYDCVSARGLPDMGDSLHFNSKALRHFGKRYAKAFKAISDG
jgi:hypothetical protein